VSTGQPFHPQVRSTWYQGSAYTERPTLAGVRGNAWRATLRPVGQRLKPDHDASVARWIVQAPGCHPFWDHWALTVIHLRPIEGVPAPVIRTPGATHEVLFLSLNPEEPLPPLDTTTWGPHYRLPFMSPPDLATQIAVANDAVADHMLELAIATIVSGGASPDQDFRAWWEKSFAETAGHFNAGKHRLS
jgi:hypothetical protein